MTKIEAICNEGLKGNNSMMKVYPCIHSIQIASSQSLLAMARVFELLHRKPHSLTVIAFDR